MTKLLSPLFRPLVALFNRYMFIRYVFSGGTAAAIDVILLYVLTQYFGVYYLSAAIFAMTVSFIARFLLQKFVTFQDKDESQSTRQFIAYSILYGASLLATTGLLYVFVEYFHLWYVPAQILTIGLIACVSYFIYRLFVFKK